jgi:hypothetical protein
MMSTRAQAVKTKARPTTAPVAAAVVREPHASNVQAQRIMVGFHLI